jgi:hypothetical protein
VRNAEPPRIAAARRRTATVNRALAIGSAAAFAAVLVLARVTHPGHAARAQGTRAAASRSSENDDDGFDFGSGTLSSSGSAQPQVQTNVS